MAGIGAPGRGVFTWHGAGGDDGRNWREYVMTTVSTPVPRVWPSGPGPWTRGLRQRPDRGATLDAVTVSSPPVATPRSWAVRPAGRRCHCVAGWTASTGGLIATPTSSTPAITSYHLAARSRGVRVPGVQPGATIPGGTSNPLLLADGRRQGISEVIGTGTAPGETTAGRDVRWPAAALRGGPGWSAARDHLRRPTGNLTPR
jgi:hypothetical protein